MALRQIHVLVDLGNTDGFRSLTRPNPNTVADTLEGLVDRSARTLSDVGSVVELRFRLYHGWYDAYGRPTDLHNLARPHVQTYPTLRRACRIFVALAVGPVGIAGQTLSHTYREAAGLPPASLLVADDLPASCTHPASCMVPQLRSWLRKGRCPEAAPPCPTRLTDVVTHRRQKLIDTALVADAVWLAAQGSDIAIFSDDEDVVPGLLAASTYRVNVAWLCRGGAPRAAYSQLIAQQRIRCLEC